MSALMDIFSTKTIVDVIVEVGDDCVAWPCCQFFEIGGDFLNDGFK